MDDRDFRQYRQGSWSREPQPSSSGAWGSFPEQRRSRERHVAVDFRDFPSENKSLTDLLQDTRPGPSRDAYNRSPPPPKGSRSPATGT